MMQTQELLPFESIYKFPSLVCNRKVIKVNTALCYSIHSKFLQIHAHNNNKYSSSNKNHDDNNKIIKKAPE
jgi:hypothetical protein